ncbi:hypothetical protein CONPUDRAFT_137692 [Coniophora puteana RWD-64-598 SS2]|uniref:L-type lectin-like domain-containing protein n=1 Tax=Coniophora puteana (strain RWD-64-598) TaxID=741705 RepID=A0A5M3MPM4_CONPW|nr:uncharacterized protein CONPUDRAFT_137692 [Coniophora puteana RWD-64-598 SS2]EIW80521.1 hypothetical protein CONPUDRAFT_137692 [Coniophora puteana RWD-64-598 SS2]
MLARFCSVLYALLLSLCILSGVQANTDKVANKTIERSVQLRTHSIFPPYIDQDLQNRWWDFGADTYINTNKHIRLTQSRPGQNGWLWTRYPLTAPNFVIEVEFKVSGQSSHLYGDGMAIWLTKDRAETGTVFGSKDKFEGLGIFLDTYANSRHPYGFPRIVAMMGDGNTAYDQDNDGHSQALGSCSANFRRTNVDTKLKLTYVKGGYLDVQVRYKAWDDWTHCFRLEDVNLPSAPYLGLSAMTGQVFDSHDVISVASWSAVLSGDNAQKDKMPNHGDSWWSPRDTIFSPSSASDEPAKGTWLGFLLKLVLGLGVCAGALWGWNQYRLRKLYGPRAGMFGGLGYSNSKKF